MKYFLILAVLLLSCKNENNNSEQTDVLYSETSFAHKFPEKVIVYDKLNFGNGYNSVTGQEFFGVIEYENVEKNTEVVGGARGNSGFIKMEILEDKESLKSTLNVNASVDLNLKIYGVTSNNTAKVDVYRETSFDSFTQNALLHAQYANEPTVMLNARVKEEWVKLAKKNPDEFMRTCGDMFVSKIYTGGSLYTLLSLESHDAYQKEKNNTFFKSVNEYMGNQLNVEASTEQMTESESSVTNKKTTVFTEGGNELPQKNSLADLITYANQFKTQVTADNRPVVLYVELSPYESIAGFPKSVDFDKIRIGQKEFLESASDFYNDIDQSMTTARFVTDNQKYFDKVDVQEADSILIRFQSLITDARALLNRCKSDFNDCDFELLANARGGFEVYDPDIDFPEFSGTEKELPVTPNQDFITVFDNTGSGKKISIEGRLESRVRNHDTPSCKDVSFASSRTSYLHKKMQVDKSWWRTDYVDVYEYYERPYFLFRYISTETGEELKRFPWQGSPFESEPNVRVDIKLVNPPARLQWRYNYANKNYQKNYVDVGKKLEKKLNFQRSPHFNRIRSCATNGAPRVIISPLTAAENRVMNESPGQSETPTVIFKDGLATYSYN